MNKLLFLNGGPGAIRTPDLLIRSHTSRAEISRFNANKLYFAAHKIKWLAIQVLKSVEMIRLNGFQDRYTIASRSTINQALQRVCALEIAENTPLNGRTCLQQNRTIGG